MPYIGKDPVIGEFIELDALTASATADYALTRNGAAYKPATVNNLLVSINGVIQAGSTMSLSGNTLTVGATLSSSDTIDFVRVLGSVGNVSEPTDGSVTSAKLANDIAVNTLDVATIRASNGTTAATIDSSGRVFQPTKPAFRVTLGGNQSVSGALTEHVVSFAETAASQNCFIQGGITLSSGVITVPVDGVYTFNMVLRVDGIGSGYLLGQLRRNSDGAGQKSLYVLAGTPMPNQQFLTGSTTFKLDAGDTIDVTVFANNDSSFTVIAYSEISGHLVG